MDNPDDFQMAPCVICGDQYPKCVLDEHTEQCSASMLACKFCGEFVPDISIHQPQCKAFALQDTEDMFCEYCKEKIFANFKEEHYADCALKQISDAYQTYQAKECPICLTDIGPVDQKGVLQCCHVFHQACLTDWQQKSKECPVCRYN